MSKSKTNTTRVSKPTEIASVKPQPFAPPEPKLTDFQKHVCELAGDIIVNGAHEDDLENLICAVLAHQRRRMFPDCPKDPKEREKSIDSAINKDLENWRNRLIRRWPEKAAEKETPTPQTVTEIVRANARGRLKWEFEEFLQRANPEDIAFARDVMLGWRSEYGSFCEPEWGVCGLATAFADEIDRNEVYIRVPDHHKEAVEKFLTLLPQDECGGEAA